MKIFKPVLLILLISVCHSAMAYNLSAIFRFFIVCKENNSTNWFGNRSLGACHMNVETERRQVYHFDEASSNQTRNDIFTIHGKEHGMWFKTRYGPAYLL